MNFIRNALRQLTPFGLIERHRRRFQLKSVGLPISQEVAEAAAACRYELWPAELRRPREPWVLLDVGANNGDFTAAVAKLAKLQAVHAFEPQPECRVSLQRVLAGMANSHLHAAAVGAESGQVELNCTANTKMASVLVPASDVAADYAKNDFAVRQKISVPLVRLDDVIPRGTPIGLLKIDVQGYELEVLEGASETLRSTFALLMEVNYAPHYEGGVTFDELHQTVIKHGFRTFGISAPYGGKDGPLWADAMFIRC